MARGQLTRRAVLTVFPATISAMPASAGVGPAHRAAVGQALIDELAAALSAALAAHSGGKMAITVHPQGYTDTPVALFDLDQARDEATSLSGELVQAICGHLAAYSALGHASRAADPVRLGRKPTTGEADRLDQAADQADAALLAICRHAARNAPERREKAAYLLGHFLRDELEAEHVVAILESERSTVATSASAYASEV